MKSQQLPTIDPRLAVDEAGGAVRPPAQPMTEAPKLGPIERQQQSSVSLSVVKDDRTILTAVIDRTASRKRIINDISRVLPEFSVPYRELERGIVEALRIRLKEDMTFGEASLRAFGTPDRAGAIRRWRNRWGLR